TARETARETTLQQEQAMRISSSMSEISTAVHEISKTTQRAAQDARKAEENAHTGGETIHTTVNTIQQLLGANQATAPKIEALADIIHGSEAMQTMVTQIASSSSEQSAAAQSVNANLNEIASIGVRTTHSSSRAVDACDRLAALADDLNQLVGAFKVRNALS